MHYCGRDSHATSRTAIYANITQTGRIRVYCSWFWVVLVGFVGFVGGFGWFWVVLLVVLGGFGSFWVVLGGFGWFRVLVTTVHKHPLLQKSCSWFSSFVDSEVFFDSSFTCMKYNHHSHVFLII